MGQESCAVTYSNLFSPELKEIFRENKLSIPYILEFLESDDVMCEDTECTHHVFHKCMDFEANNIGTPTKVDVPWVKECHRCMCLLGLVGELITLQDIADANGVTKQAILRHESAALDKLQRRFKNKSDGEFDWPRSPVRCYEEVGKIVRR